MPRTGGIDLKERRTCFSRMLGTWRTPDEIDGKPLGRQICNESMVFYRAADGQVAALGLLPHRGAPLSLGFVRDGVLRLSRAGNGLQRQGGRHAGQRVGGFPPIRSFP